MIIIFLTKKKKNRKKELEVRSAVRAERNISRLNSNENKVADSLTLQRLNRPRV